MWRSRVFRMQKVRWNRLSFLVLGCLPISCTTAEHSPKPKVELPPLIQVNHPAGTDLADVEALFTDPLAPKEQNFAKDCDQDLIKLKRVAPNKEVLAQGVRELIRKDPVFYHWCFYGKLLKLDADLKSNQYLDAQQKIALDTFQVLTPVARGFAEEFRDSRYLRWTVMRYQKISAQFFFRKLDLAPEGTALLVKPQNPLGRVRSAEALTNVLEKYHLESNAPSWFPSLSVTGDKSAEISSFAVAPSDGSASPIPLASPLPTSIQGGDMPAQASRESALPVDTAPSVEGVNASDASSSSPATIVDELSTVPVVTVPVK